MIIEKKLAILFWIIIVAVAMIMFSVILNPANAIDVVITELEFGKVIIDGGDTITGELN